jgi:hypothetical protein
MLRSHSSVWTPDSERLVLKHRICAWLRSVAAAHRRPSADYLESSTFSIHANGSRISALVGRLSGAPHARLSSLMP